MDDLDRALIESWWRVWERCRADPAEARRRWVRARSSVTLNSPSRAWCLGIRASDTRITRAYGLQKYGAAREAHLVQLGVQDILEWCGPVRVPYPGVPIDEAADRLGRHVETVRRWLPMRQGRTRGDRLNRQITRDVDYTAGTGGRPPMASGALGGHDATASGRRLRTSGGRGWGVRYVPPKTVGRHQGAGVPVVWCDRAVDPGHQGGAPPIAWWGSMWEGLAERFAREWGARAGGRAPGGDDDVLAAARVPRWAERRRTAHGPAVREFRGWDWVCPGPPEVTPEAPLEVPPEASAKVSAPGRVGSDFRGGRGDTSRFAERCGRRAQVLVCPLPAWTIGDYLADRPGVGEGLDVGEAERWVPGRAGWGDQMKPRMASAVSGGGGSPPMASAALYAGRFACVRCWGVRNVTQRGRGGWNEFVGRISGGLLTGKDVRWEHGAGD
ncbi:MAG: hypothetical protein AAF333_18680 [Planctomycetota bacterium]